MIDKSNEDPQLVVNEVYQEILFSGLTQTLSGKKDSTKLILLIICFDFFEII